MISYEIPLGLAVLCVVVLFGTLDLGQLVEKQCHNWAVIFPAWNVCSQPLAFIMFLVCIHAEANLALPSIWPRPSRNWSAAITPNTAPCDSPCFSWVNTRA